MIRENRACADRQKNFGPDRAAALLGMKPKIDLKIELLLSLRYLMPG
jgi:hypothetical protein